MQEKCTKASVGRSIFRKLVLTIALVWGAVHLPAQEVGGGAGGPAREYALAPVVDPRVELMSIVARLAGYEEYRNDYLKQYAEDVDRHFERHKDHPAVRLAMKLREKQFVAFDAVMAMAAHLSPPPALSPRVAFTGKVPDERWGKDAGEQFAGLLSRFYADSDAGSFFEAHADLYREARRRFQHVLDAADLDWFRRFFGESGRPTYHLCIALLNGGNGYGARVMHPDGQEEVYAFISAWKVDETGLPEWDEKEIPNIIHEYAHSFINPLMHENAPSLGIAGEKVHSAVATRMQALHYGDWQTTLAESLVRAAVLRYRYESAHGADGPKAYARLISERNKGFLWMEELFALLGAYEQSRSTYPTFRSFLPLIIGYYQDLAGRIEDKVRKFEELSPRVVALEPFENEAQEVAANIERMTIRFNKPLDKEAGYSISKGPSGNEHFPIESVIGFDEAGGAFSVRLKLKPDWEYEFVVMGVAFWTQDGYPLQQYTVKFKTKKADTKPRLDASENLKSSGGAHK